MNIKCKSPGCSGFVAYKPGETEFLALRIQLKENILDDMESAELEKTVKNVIKADTNEFKTTKTIYLTCDSVPSHTYGYPLPA
jgi:hypothetical protein